MELSGISYPTTEHSRHLDAETYSGPKYFLLCIIWKNEEYIFSESVLRNPIKEWCLIFILSVLWSHKIFNLIFSFCGVSVLNCLRVAQNSWDEECSKEHLFTSYPNIGPERVELCISLWHVETICSQRRISNPGVWAISVVHSVSCLSSLPRFVRFLCCRI